MTKQPVPGLHQNFAEEAAMTDKAMVTDAMVEAVAWSASSQPGQPFGMNLTDDDIRNILTIGLENSPAALAQAEQPVAVKPLGWITCGEVAFANTAFGSYEVRPSQSSRSTDDRFELLVPGEKIRCAHFATEQLGRSAADADFKARILSALSPSKIEAGENTAEAAPPPVTDLGVTDFANRLFNLHGFMLLHSAGSDGKPTITISFPDLKEAQQFHNTLVELSQHRATTEGSDNG